MSIISFLQLMRNEPEMISMIPKLIKGSHRIFLLGTPHHGNLGDHMIAESELYFFNTFLPSYQVLDCTMQFSKVMLDRIINNLKGDDIIVISGGGWLGTEWRHNEEFVRNVIMSFPDNRVIILPQTAYYRNDDEYLKLGAQIYRAHPDLYFCARDKLTFELIKNNDFMESQRLLYMPDMALYSTLWKRKGDIEKHVDNQIGLCLRDDRELVMSDSMREKIIAEVRRFDPDYTEIRTNESDRSIRVNQREENILRKLREISNLKLLVTDRLHAMIMAAITDTPCIAFDNSTHKVKGTYDWIKELDYIRFLNSPDNITEIIEQMIDCSIYHMRFDMWDKTEYLRRISEWF